MYCSPHRKNNKKTCYTAKQLKKIAQAWNAYNGKKMVNPNVGLNNLWEDLNKQLKDQCNNEWCWMERDFMSGYRDREFTEETFRPTGPHEKKWLSTSQIARVLKQYQKEVADFISMGPVPIDFANFSPEIAQIDVKYLHKKGITKVGIVFNTDPSDKPGQHWISMFIDFNEAEIGFFDSFGKCPPPMPIQELISHISSQPTISSSKRNNWKIQCNTIRHQRANTECGVYCIYFISERLKGRSFREISRSIVRDEEMVQQRREYFRPNTN